MITKSVFLLFTQAILIQYISAQCIGNAYNFGENFSWGSAAGQCASPATWNAASYAAAGAPLSCANAEWAAATGHSPAALAASNYGSFAITSASPIPPTGVAMTSENAYEGPLAVSGSLPFLGAIALEGALPTGGAGAVSYGSGNGNIGMLREDVAPTYYNSLDGAYGYGPGAAAELGYGYGFPQTYEAGFTGFGSPLVYETGIPGSAYGYRGFGCGAI